jgi:hypothetical protein
VIVALSAFFILGHSLLVIAKFCNHLNNTRMKKTMTKAENFEDESPMSRGKITLQYPLQFVRRMASAVLAFSLIIGLLSDFATAHAGAIVPLDGPVLAGEPVTFRIIGNHDIHWDLGDGATAQGPSVTHTYQKPGVYRVVTVSRDESYPVPRIYELSAAIVRVHTPETLHLPQILLDTDAHNEVDDQHYIAYALYSEMDVLGINSVHHTRWTENWTNETRTGYIGSETQNYNEILNILDLMKRSGLPDKRVPRIYRGAREPLKNMNIDVNRWFDTNPIVTEASEVILAAARGASPDNPVWVLPVGPCTNIASAILQARQEGWEKEFNRRIRVCWLGGGPRSLISNTFNGGNDPWSVYVTVQSGIEFLMILEHPTGSSFKFDKTVEGHLYPDNPLGDYLRKITPARPKNLYDITVLSMIIGGHLGEHWLTRVEPSILLGRDQGYEYRLTTEPTNLHIVWAVDGEAMKKDFFNTLNGKPTALPPNR